jgi:hypothetical protein
MVDLGLCAIWLVWWLVSAVLLCIWCVRAGAWWL